MQTLSQAIYDRGVWDSIWADMATASCQGRLFSGLQEVLIVNQDLVLFQGLFCMLSV